MKGVWIFFRKITLCKKAGGNLHCCCCTEFKGHLCGKLCRVAFKKLAYAWFSWHADGFSQRGLQLRTTFLHLAICNGISRPSNSNISASTFLSGLTNWILISLILCQSPVSPFFSSKREVSLSLLMCPNTCEFFEALSSLLKFWAMHSGRNC